MYRAVYDPANAVEPPAQGEEEDTTDFGDRFRALQEQFLSPGVTYVPDGCVCSDKHETMLRRKDAVIDLLSAEVRRLKAQLKAVRLAAKDRP
jgi:hypothetical protein